MRTKSILIFISGVCLGFVLGFLATTELVSYLNRKNYEENPPLPVVVPEEELQDDYTDGVQGILLNP